MTEPTSRPPAPRTRGRAAARVVAACEYAAISALFCMIGFGLVAFGLLPLDAGPDRWPSAIRWCIGAIAAAAAVGAARPLLSTPAAAARTGRDELAQLLTEAEDQLRDAAAADAAAAPMPPLPEDATAAQIQAWKLKATIREIRGRRWPDTRTVLAGRIHDYRHRHGLYVPREDNPQ